MEDVVKLEHDTAVSSSILIGERGEWNRFFSLCSGCVDGKMEREVCMCAMGREREGAPFQRHTHVRTQIYIYVYRIYIYMQNSTTDMQCLMLIYTYTYISAQRSVAPAPLPRRHGPRNPTGKPLCDRISPAKRDGNKDNQMTRDKRQITHLPGCRPGPSTRLCRW